MVAFDEIIEAPKPVTAGRDSHMVKDLDSDIVSLSRAIGQIEANCYDSPRGSKSVAKKDRIPNPKKIKEYISMLYDCMDIEDWKQLGKVFQPIMFPQTKVRRGRPPGDFAGMTNAERAAAKKEKARKLGIWSLKYPDGCTECKSKSYGEASGGICNRCYATLRDSGLTLRQYKERKASNE